MYFLFANPLKPPTIELCREVAGILLAQGEQVQLDEWLYNQLHLGISGTLETLTPECRAVIAVGGDGTLLRTVSSAATLGIPMLGINMGRVGFLLETDPKDLEGVVSRLRDKAYRLDERSMLQASINGAQPRLVLNDVVLCRGSNPSSITVHVTANTELVYTTHGDGVIVSTSTGSTAYCLSAGGPVLHPQLDCTVVLPICTHKAQQLPIVMSADTQMSLRAEAVARRSYQVILDGQTDLEIHGDVLVEIRRASVRAKFIRLEEQGFFTRLRLKQAEWSGK